LACLDDPGNPAYSYKSALKLHGTSELTYVDLRSRPLVPIHGSSRVSEVQVCISEDLVDGLASSRILHNQPNSIPAFGGLTRQRH
jgi:hypothetical protein